jgi:transcriptional regulator NrdR family protein
MRCKCGGKYKTLDTRSYELSCMNRYLESGYTRRRKQCLECDEKVTTVEMKKEEFN